MLRQSFSILFRKISKHKDDLGFVEMMAFQDLATDVEKAYMDFLLRQEDYERAWDLLQEVTHTHLEHF